MRSEFTKNASRCGSTRRYISSRRYVIHRRENALHYNNLLYSIVTFMEHIGLVDSCIKKANNDGMIAVSRMKREVMSVRISNNCLVIHISISIRSMHL